MPEFIPQAIGVPFRRESGIVLVCLITTYSGARWGLPKGIIDPGEDVESTIANEAWEEAGISGTIWPDVLLRMQYTKWNAVLDAEVRLLEVHEQADHWLESEVRTRRWLTFADALDLPMRSGYRHCLRLAADWLHRCDEG